MRILIIAMHFWPDVAGNAGTTTGRARYLASQEHAVTVLTGLPYYPGHEVRAGYRRRAWMRGRLDGIDVRRRWHLVPHGDTAAHRIAQEATFATTALTALTLPRPDLVLAVTPALSGGLAGAIVARRFGVPFGLFVQDLTAQAARQSGMRGAARVAGAAARVEGWVTRRASRVAILAEGFRAPLRALGVRDERIRLVPDWTPIEPQEHEPTAARRAIGLPDGFLCVYSGSMGNKQGLEFVVEAARLAQAEGLPATFVLVGDGPRRAALEHTVATQQLRNVRFLPLQPDHLYPQLLAAADVLLMPQRASVTNMAFPSKIVQYLGAGRPVLAAVQRASEAGRVLDASGGAVIVSPEDAAAMTAALRALSGDPERRLAMGRAGQSYARDHYAREALARSLDAFIADLAAARD